MADEMTNPEPQPAESIALRVSLPETVPADMSTEKIVDAEIQDFNTQFQALGNDPLIHFEKAAIKTYLAWKLGVKKTA